VVIKNSKGEKLTEQQCLDIVGNKIRSCRKSRKLTIQGLADKCEVDYSQISRMERGLLNFTYFTLLKVAAALDVDPKELQP
jgi:transcriptional regulator with XRE-family HTH domain